ncbi:MAG: hypothetical protein NT917_07990, partial [Microcystis aeruginosa WS75]|nr:hypothetical protein [Microcystis aeruginosa WS75]
LRQVRNPARERSRNLNREVWESPSVYGGEDVNQSDVFTKHFWGYGSKIRASQGLNPNLTEFFNPLN